MDIAKELKLQNKSGVELVLKECRIAKKYAIEVLEDLTLITFNMEKKYRPVDLRRMEVGTTLGIINALKTINVLNLDREGE